MVATQKVPQSALEIYELLPEGTRCEVIENILYMSPAPSTNHQWLQMILGHELMSRVRKNARVLAPSDTYFELLQSAFQPDILVILNNRLDIIRKNGVYGAPDVVLEILSPDSERDTIKKKNVYEQGGVREYFVIDPDTRNTTCWLLVNGRFEEQYSMLAGWFKSTVLDIEFEFDYEFQSKK